MMFLPHVLFGILSGVLGCKFSGCNNTFLFAAVAAIASTIPDIDHFNSRISRKLPPFSIILNTLFNHRGFIHSLIPALMVYAVMSRLSQSLAAAVLIGYASHLLLDATTTRGVRPFYPLKFRIKGFIRTNSFMERIVTLLLLIAVISVIVSEIL